MKFKFLAVVALASFIGMSGCKGESNTNVNANKANTNTATPVPKTSETAAANTAEKTKIEDALKKAGFPNVTVDTSTTPATLRGTYPKGKKAEDVAKAAQEAAGKPVKNEATEEK